MVKRFSTVRLQSLDELEILWNSRKIKFGSMSGFAEKTIATNGAAIEFSESDKMTTEMARSTGI